MRSPSLQKERVTIKDDSKETFFFEIQEEYEIERIKNEIKKEKETKDFQNTPEQILQNLIKNNNAKNNNNKVVDIGSKKNEYSFKEVAESETLVNSQAKAKAKIIGTATYAFRYNAVYSLIYFTIIIFVLYFFILLRDFVQNHLNEQLTNTLNTILKLVYIKKHFSIIFFLIF